MSPEVEFQLRRLVLTVSTFTFLLSSIAICALQLFPQDSFAIKTSVSLYLFFFAVSNITGFIAALKVRAQFFTPCSRCFSIAINLTDIYSETQLLSPYLQLTSWSIVFSYSYPAFFLFSSARPSLR
jgi:hypothetical protein